MLISCIYVIVMNIINTSEFSITQYTYQAAETCFSLSGLSNKNNDCLNQQSLFLISYQSCQIGAEVT